MGETRVPLAFLSTLAFLLNPSGYPQIEPPFLQAQAMVVKSPYVNLRIPIQPLKQVPKWVVTSPTPTRDPKTGLTSTATSNTQSYDQFSDRQAA